MISLYLLESIEWHGYDTAQGFVIQAETGTEAREIAAKNCGDEGPDVWRDYHQSTVQILSYTTCYDGDEPVILRDFQLAGGIGAGTPSHDDLQEAYDRIADLEAENARMGRINRRFGTEINRLRKLTWGRDGWPPKGE